MLYDAFKPVKCHSQNLSLMYNLLIWLVSAKPKTSEMEPCIAWQLAICGFCVSLLEVQLCWLFQQASTQLWQIINVAVSSFPALSQQARAWVCSSQPLHSISGIS